MTLPMVAETLGWVPIGGRGPLEDVEAEGLVINTVGLISILYQLLERKGGTVGLNHSVRHWVKVLQ